MYIFNSRITLFYEVYYIIRSSSEIILIHLGSSSEIIPIRLLLPRRIGIISPLLSRRISIISLLLLKLTKSHAWCYLVKRLGMVNLCQFWSIFAKVGLFLPITYDQFWSTFQISVYFGLFRFSCQFRSKLVDLSQSFSVIRSYLVDLCRLMSISAYICHTWSISTYCGQFWSTSQISVYLIYLVYYCLSWPILV